MRVSLRSTYGIMAAVDMAMQAGSAPIQAKSIARRQGIPARFLEQVLHAMKKAGLVSSLRGAQGGYVLSKKPADLSRCGNRPPLDHSLLSCERYDAVIRHPRPHNPHAPVGKRCALSTLLEEHHILHQMFVQSIHDRAGIDPA